MGIFDKIKNALFEEEYVEVEDKPKVKREKPKKENVKESKPIAKKVVLPEKDKDKLKKEAYIEKVNEEEPIDEDFDIEPLTEKSINEFKFPMIDDKDFGGSDTSYNEIEEEPEIVRVIESDSYYKEKEKEKKEKKSYQEKEEKHPYGINNDDKINVHEYGAYEKKDEKKIFRPSPIISPIYGVLDKNYKKEEIVPRREVRLTSSYSRENLNVDDVRNKAYGSLSDDIVREIREEPSHKYEEEYSDVEEDNLLVDLSVENEKPQVQEITMGDAEEYFQDLGLEYNIDYKDVTKEKATGRRSRESYDDVEDNKEVSVESDNNYDYKDNNQDNEKENESTVTKDIVDIDSDDNLFDLIDSMYEEEK